jgi:hypothetical protein
MDRANEDDPTIGEMRRRRALAEPCVSDGVADEEPTGISNPVSGGGSSRMSRSRSAGREKRPTSPSQVRANRRNAKQSTGPRTEKGKRRSSQNATRHGGSAQTLFAIPTGVLAEDEEQLQADVDAIVRCLAPRDALERAEAKQVALPYIRIDRIDKYESQVLAEEGAWHQFSESGPDIPGDHSVAGARASHLARIYPELVMRECRRFIDHILRPDSLEERDWLAMVNFVHSMHDEPILGPLDSEDGIETRDHRSLFFSLVRCHWESEETAVSWALKVTVSVTDHVRAVRMVGSPRASRTALAGEMHNAAKLRAAAEKSLLFHMSIYERLRARPLANGDEDGQFDIGG